ncbi:winged helix DNA-binding protein [Vibrio sp. SS-MA-C1-2]|uniref:MarR family winged helix-turn-helix transcriptional regulator n=1 Tax=Vibrio sp. SS-MA-C1-2 TaxID=2908646 RepID=UPI001F36D532|nr:MarR family transcriptional regulator [Vibrio sp. SS-MA-C1-2]UJF18449.1 winged helix DNA-binding protein [Vibrio sp. SS-MA-C1-2]
MKNSHYLMNLIGTFSTNVDSQIRENIDSLNSHGINHESALVTIYNHPDDNINTLSKVLGLTHSGTVRLINKLEGLGYLLRVKSQNDGRNMTLQLTDTGRSRAVQVLSKRDEVTKAVIDMLDDEQKSSLTSILESVLEKMTNNTEEARRTCRLCNEGVCRNAGCPVEKSIN